MPDSSSTDPPLYMELGSKGQAVKPVVEFLLVWAKQHEIDLPELVAQIRQDVTLYGPEVLKLMQLLQADAHIESDGACGPQTRAHLQERHHFDLAMRAQKMGKAGGITKFVQPTGDSLYWGPGIQATSDARAAEAAYKQAWSPR